jgi:hypothetical protein
MKVQLLQKRDFKWHTIMSCKDMVAIDGEPFVIVRKGLEQ